MPIALFFKSNEEEVIKYFSFLFKETVYICALKKYFWEF